MNDIEHILALLDEKKIKLFEENGNLRLTGPKGAVDTYIIEKIKLYKEDIIKYLKYNSASLGNIPLAAEQVNYSISPLQKRIWILSQYEKETNPAYNLGKVVTIYENLDIGKFKAAYFKLLQRYEIFRSRYILDNDIPRVILVNDNSIFHHLPILDLSDIPEKNKKIDEILKSDICRKFILNEPPFYTGKLIKINEGEFIFSFFAYHIIIDGISLDILWDELLEIYQNGILPEISTEYKDFSEQYVRFLSSGNIDRLRKYWIQEFTPLPNLNSLSYDFLPNQEKSFEGNRVSFALTEQETARLENIAKENGVTIFPVIYSLFNLFLHFLSSENDITLGIPISLRTEPVEKTIGMFINTLAIRHTIDPSKDFGTYLSEINEKLLNAYEHKEFPFDQLVDELNLINQGGKNPLFNNMVLWLGDKTIDNNIGLKIAPYTYKAQYSQFEFSIEGYKENKKIHFSFSYSTQLFTERTIKNFAVYFQYLLKQIIEDPNKKINEYNLADAHTQYRILKVYNRPIFYNISYTLNDIFKKTYLNNVDRIAITYESNKGITYGLLERKTNQIALFLRKKGIKPNDIVGVISKSSPVMLFAIHGIIKSGGAYLPIDPEYPAKRIDFILNDSQPKILLVDSEYVLTVDDKLEVVTIDDDFFSIQPSGMVENCNNSDDLAYVLYTSGSTGYPKGVMIDHKAVINRINWMQKAYPIHPEDVILQKTSYTFDVSVWEIFWWMFTGSKVYLLDNEDRKEPRNIVNVLLTQKITVLHFVPTMLGTFIKYLDSANDQHVLSDIKYIFSSGEALSAAIVKDVSRFLNLTKMQLINLYGPTEATIDVSHYNCQLEQNLEIIPIGKPIENTRLYIMNKYGRLVPEGIIGELCIEGIGLAKGYLNNQQLTSEKFVISPFNPDGKIYKTGDLCRWMEDGNIEYIGRIDDQIKIRGYRIELNEIASVINQINGIKESIVLTHKFDDNDIRLIAFYIAGSSISTLVIRKEIKKQLPDYMVPSHFFELDNFPVNSNGKVDKKKLALHFRHLSNTSSNYREPVTDAQSQVAAIWHKLLKVEKIGLDDNFFNLGGNSLLTIQAIIQIKKLFEKDIFIKDFVNSNLEQLVAKII